MLVAVPRRSKGGLRRAPCPIHKDVFLAPHAIIPQHADRPGMVLRAWGPWSGGRGAAGSGVA